MLNNGGYIFRRNAMGVYQLHYYAVCSCTRYFYESIPGGSKTSKNVNKQVLL